MCKHLLLPLYGHQVDLHLANDPLFDELLQQALQPLLEYPRHDVGAVGGSLSRQQILHYLRPLWVSPIPPFHLIFNFLPLKRRRMGE